MDNRQMIKPQGKQFKRWLCEEDFKTPLLATHFNILWIYRQALTHYCHLHGPSLAPQINCNKIMFSHTRRWYFSFLFFFFFFWYFRLFYVILFLLILFSWKIFLFFHVPGCSGKFRHISECSVFQVLSTLERHCILLFQVAIRISRQAF